jgi:DNA polymerase I-like protein with 3'-5' exonuclease and polymerase domains
MGGKKLGEKLGIPKEDALALLARFDEYVPFVKRMAENTTNKAKTRGWIRTICGRRRHFDLWEPAGFGEYGRPVRGRDAAIKEYGKNIKRSHTHKALNALIQGSSADMTKMAMLKVWRETGKVPIMPVHDELNYSVNSEAEAREIKLLQESAIPLEVPMWSGLHIGETWK